VTPPKWARALLDRAVADDASGRSIVGDFEDEFVERLARVGIRRARWWYWRQAIGMWWWSAWTHPSTSFHHPRGDLLSGLVGDLRNALRLALRTPGQTLLIVGTLGVAIGTTTVGFSFADTIVLRGLPITDPNAAVIVFGVDSRDPERRAGVFVSDYLDFRDRARSVERLSTWAQTRVTLRRRGADPARVTVSRVSGDLFGVWGLHTQVGRGLLASDTVLGAAPVAVLSDRTWADLFARSPAVIGEEVLVDGVQHTVVGVLTPDIEFGTFANIAMWVSYPLPQNETRDLSPVVVTGRLAPGATIEHAAAELRTIATALEQEHPASNRGRQVLVLQASRAMGGPNFWLVMTLLVGTAGLVTIIASVNVAGILMSRAVARQREFALRAALGARRVRVFRQLLVEGVLLAVAGGAAGLLVAEVGLQLIRSVEAEPILQQLLLDWHEVVFVTLLSLCTPIVFSMAPALAAFRVDLVTTLNASTVRSGGTGRRFRETLVVAQLALAIALAIVGGLVARTANAHYRAANGFDVENVITFIVSLDQTATSGRRLQTVRTMLDQFREHGLSADIIEALPAVATESTAGLVSHDANVTAAEPWVHATAIGSGTLDTLRVPILEGRMFTAAEIDSAAPVVLVSAETARRYFSNTSIVGRHIDLRRGDTTRAYQVIGVTGDVRNADPERGTPPRVWVPFADPTTVTFVVRHPGDAAASARAIREVARAVVPGVPVESLESYTRAIARRQGSDRVAMGMLLTFAATAVLFAAIGLYGTVALTAALRRVEFATRYALGATTRDVMRLVLTQAVKLVAIGLVPGLTLGLLAGAAMRQLLFGVTPFDPVNVLIVLLLLAVVALVASMAPALRAARIDIIDSMRAQ
jgi:putative ABC transport system permease protein